MDLQEGCGFDNRIVALDHSGPAFAYWLVEAMAHCEGAVNKKGFSHLKIHGITRPFRLFPESRDTNNSQNLVAGMERIKPPVLK